LRDNDWRVRAVYDCNVFLQGLINSRSVSNRCLRLWIAGDVILYVSRPILLEIRDVLLRPELQTKFPSLTYERVAVLFEILQRHATLLDAVPTHFRFERDIKDEPYLNAAIGVDAQYIVTRDNDMLDLMHGTDSAGQAFRAAYPGISIVDPNTFVGLFPITDAPE
jgi:putative PIN family toxin of toxin-antitoxin system